MSAKLQKNLTDSSLNLPETAVRYFYPKYVIRIQPDCRLILRDLCKTTSITKFLKANMQTYALLDYFNNLFGCIPITLIKPSHAIGII